MANLTSARRSALRSSAYSKSRKRRPRKMNMGGAITDEVQGYAQGGAVPGSDMDFKSVRGRVTNFGRAVKDRIFRPSISAPVSQAGTAAVVKAVKPLAVDQRSVLKRREAAAGLNRGGSVLRSYGR